MAAARKAPSSKRPARKTPARKASSPTSSKRPAKKAPAKKAPARKRGAPRVSAVVVEELPESMTGPLRAVRAFIEARKVDKDWSERHDALAQVAEQLARKLPLADLAAAGVARELRETIDQLRAPGDDDVELEFLADSADPV